MQLKIWLICFSLMNALALDCEQLSPTNYHCTEVQSFRDLTAYIDDKWRSISVANKRVGLAAIDDIGPLFSAIQKLDLSRSTSLEIKDNGFKDFTGLKELNVSHCQLEEFNANFFPNNTKLQNVDASFNEILKITKANTINLPNLVYANFSNNLIANLEVDSFKALKRLIFLDLTTNEQENITLGECASLRYLSMSNNNLRDFPWRRLCGVPNLEELHLHSNWLEKLDDRIFNTLKLLRVLNVSNNNIEQIQFSLFRGTEKAPLQLLDMSSNNIQTLIDYLFSNLSNLEVLDLSYNNIDVLRSHVLSGLSSLRVLRLQSNQLRKINDFAFEELKALEQLDLSHNKLQNVNMRIFGNDGLLRLRYLDLELNNISSLHPLAFSSLPRLEFLSLTRNKIKSLDIRMFAPLRRLATLKLGGNIIEEILPEVLESFMYLTTIEIDENCLTFLPDVNMTYPNLKTVFVEGNPWQCPCLDELVNWFDRQNISYTRRENAYFSGKKPLCVVSPLERCVKDVKTVRKQGIVNEFMET